MSMRTGRTPFSAIYDSFFSRCTDIMFMEMTELDVYNHLQDMLLNSLWRFEFPRFDLTDYTEGSFDSMGTYQGVESNGVVVPLTGWVGGFFNCQLTPEEINILSMCMMVEWFGQQLATTENTKLKYSGGDFKFSSQSAHMKTLRTLLTKAQDDLKHMERLYSRRRLTDNGGISAAGLIMSTPSYGLNIKEV